MPSSPTSKLGVQVLRHANAMLLGFTALPLALSASSRPTNFSRRAALGAAGGALVGSSFPAQAVEMEDLKVYFGAGCFWHVQHEFVLKEAQELGRSGTAFSAVTGYAGGTGVERGLVCYHNRRGVSDYGRLGHAEAVQAGPTSSPGRDRDRGPHPNLGRAVRSRSRRVPCRRLPTSSSASSGPEATAMTPRRARVEARVGLVGPRLAVLLPAASACNPNLSPPFAGPRRRVPLRARAARRDRLASLLQVRRSGRGLTDEAGGGHTPDTDVDADAHADHGPSPSPSPSPDTYTDLNLTLPSDPSL